MEPTRDVIKDLLPLYLAGEASADSRALVEEHLDRDPDLAQIRTDFGPPPMWARDPGFPTLIHIILEQQVSLAWSARCSCSHASVLG